MNRVVAKMAIVGFGLTVLFGCSKEGFTIFNMDYESAIVIQSGIGINIPYSLNTPDIATNSESAFEVNDTRKDKIEHITLKSLKLEITSPAGQEFDFLKDIELFISADGLDEMKLATIYEIENSVGNTINLTCLDSDFQEYIKSDEVNLRVRTVSDELNLFDVEVKINATFLVDAKLIGKG